MAKILLVDDVLEMVKEERALLEECNLGFEVQTASRAQEATELLEKERFDLIILDLMMPLKDGLQMLHETKRRFPRIKIIIYSAYLDKYPRETLLKEGADDVLSKPCPHDQLINAIHNALNPSSDVTLILIKGYGWKSVKNQVLATLIQKLLRKTRGSIQDAAGYMGISRECFSRMMQRLGIIR